MNFIHEIMFLLFRYRSADLNAFRLAALAIRTRMNLFGNIAPLKMCVRACD